MTIFIIVGVVVMLAMNVLVGMWMRWIHLKDQAVRLMIADEFMRREYARAGLYNATLYQDNRTGR